MKVIIEGAPGEGKSTLASFLHWAMRKLLPYAVEYIEEKIDGTIEPGEVLPPPVDRMQPRTVQLIVRNTSSEATK